VIRRWRETLVKLYVAGLVVMYVVDRYQIRRRLRFWKR